MGKVIFWIFVVFAALFVLRLYNVYQQTKRRKEAAGPEAAKPSRESTAGEAMVRCARCGIFLPRSEALLIEGITRCRDRECATHAR